MIYVVDFLGSHRGSIILDNLINGRNYQPIEFENELDEEDLSELKDYLSNLTHKDIIYLYVDTCDGPESNVEAFDWLNKNLQIDAVIAASI